MTKFEKDGAYVNVNVHSNMTLYEVRLLLNNQLHEILDAIGSKIQAEVCL